jgi:cytochrome b pre-mRNA-processing protein 3
MATAAAAESRNPRFIFHLAGVTAPKQGLTGKADRAHGQEGSTGAMPIWPFQRSRADADATLLLTAVTAASRRSAFFGADRTPDTLEGRFDLMTLNACLALIRLRADADLAPLAQAFTDQLFRQFDAGLREEGVGDMSVPKRMRRLAEAFYGRLEAYAAAIGAREGGALAAAISRNALGAEAHPFAPVLAAYALDAAERQSAAPPSAMFTLAGWPAAPG